MSHSTKAGTKVRLGEKATKNDIKDAHFEAISTKTKLLEINR